MPDHPYRPVDPKVSFPELERSILAFWKENSIFERSLKERQAGGTDAGRAGPDRGTDAGRAGPDRGTDAGRAGPDRGTDAGRAGPDRGTEWVFYEGPPTANNKPGVHHVEARAFKDLFCRFQAMRGHYVHRKAGWDCHGLPVEIEVEKQLGITQKREIEEKYGIEEFVRLCRESVQRYVDDWEKMTDRIAFWLDLDDAYWTMDRDYVESVWAILKRIWDKGLLEEDFKVVPYCPRCETSLSSHEQHQAGAYRDVTDPSIYVRFPLEDEPDTSLLVWTTTPWTLLANTLSAVGPDLDYVKVSDPDAEGSFLLVAAERVEALFGEGTETSEPIKGRSLVGRRYLPPYGFVTQPEAHVIRAGEFVTTADGSGLVHLAPYGEDDLAMLRADGLEVTQMIDRSGRVVPDGAPFGGLWVKDADPKIIEDLDQRGLLFRSEDYEHAYPHCWRCHTPLLYYPRRDWYVRTSRIRDKLQASNEAVNWQPPTIKYGRFGDWLANNVDWSLSRDRYWGTPLPIWRCDAGHDTCIGSFAELAELAGRDISDLDPHRPYVDEITIACPACSERATRVTAVIDAWFDSGSMPFAQWHYPFENEDVFERRFPADFISEAIDQTRGWFYSLLAISTLLEDESSYQNVVCLGHIVDAEGRKMSKSLGNVIDPWSILDDQGADALRWHLLTAGTAWSARRLSAEIVEESLRRFILTLWNTYSFWVTYASLEGFDPTDLDIPVADRPEMDRWILAELEDTLGEATSALEGFDAGRAGKRLDRFVDDLSNWYVRRTRRRFWRSASDTDTQAAFLTLWECLVAVAQLAAPFTPFLADEIFRNLTAPDAGAPDSVHLSDWPEARADRRDETLRVRMDVVRRLVGLGRAARTEAGVRIRQPLQRALLVIGTDAARHLSGLESQIAEELNVKEVEVLAGMEELVSYTIKPNFKALGPRFGARVKEIASALQAADTRSLVAALEEAGTASLDLGGERITLERDDLDIRIEGREGFSLAQDGAYGVALDLDITDALLGEGIAREVVRAIQDLRKSSGLAVEDRIELSLLSSADFITAALAAHEKVIAAETLAPRVDLGAEPTGDAAVDRLTLDEGEVVIGLRKL